MSVVAGIDAFQLPKGGRAFAARLASQGSGRLVPGVIVSVAIAIVVAGVATARQTHADRARERAESEARVLAAQARAWLDAADAVLLAAQRAASTGGGLAEPAFTRLEGSSLPLLIVDPRGRVLGRGDAAGDAQVPVPDALRAASTSASVVLAGTARGSLDVWREIRGRDGVVLGAGRVHLEAATVGRAFDAFGSGRVRAGFVDAAGRWIAMSPSAGAEAPTPASMAVVPVWGFPFSVGVELDGGTGWPGWRDPILHTLLAVASLALLLGVLWRWASGQLAALRRDGAELVGDMARLEASHGETVQLLAAMSQQLRAPLNAVSGLVGALQRMQMPPEQSKLVGVVALSSGVLRSVADSLLDVAELETGDTKVDLAPLNLREFIAEIVEAAKTIPGAERVWLGAEVSSDVPVTVHADRDRIARVLVHLVNNAIRFTHRGAVQLAVRCAGGTTARPVIAFAVIDSGWGIPRDVRERLARPVSSAETTQEPGLAVCRAIAVHLNGKLETISVEGVGSTVTLSVPLAIASPSGNAEAAEPGPALRVLVAEDEESSRLVMRLMLEKLGHRVVEAGDGESALRAFMEAPFDVVFLDVQMPALDGFEVARSIRSSGRPGADSIPIIGTSAFAAVGDMDAAMANGMTTYLSKPVSIADIESVLAGVVPVVPPEPAAPRAGGSPVRAAASQERNVALEELARDLGADTMRTAVRQFERDAESLLARLATAQGANDTVGVQKAAHGLKGLFRQFGLPDLARLAATLDHNPAAGSPATAADVRRVLDAAPGAIAGVCAVARAIPDDPEQPAS